MYGGNIKSWDAKFKVSFNLEQIKIMKLWLVFVQCTNSEAMKLKNRKNSHNKA